MVAIALWFLAGSLFPITAMPGLPHLDQKAPAPAHALALIRYGLLDDPTGLRNIWQLSGVTEMAALSLAVVALFAVALTAAAVRLSTRFALH